MKFRIHQSHFLELIQTVSKAVAVRTPKQVLTGILLEASTDKLTATAYDLELGIQDSVFHSEEEAGLFVEQPGSIVLPARYLNEVIRKLPNQEVSIQINNNYMAEIRSGQAEFHLHGIDAAEFPKLPTFLQASQIHIPSDLLKELIRSTAFAVSTQEVRPVLTGIHLQLTYPTLTFTATDGLRMAKRTVTLDEETNQVWNVIVPGKSLQELAKILPDDSRPVTVQFTESHSLFAVDSTLFYTRLIDGAYPDTSRIIPQAHKTELVIDVDSFTGAIDRAALIARDRDNHMVRLDIDAEKAVIYSSSPEIGNVSETLPYSSKFGDNLLIAFNAKYVMDALRAVEEGEAIIHFNGSNQPFTITKREEENALQLISPVLVR